MENFTLCVVESVLLHWLKHMVAMSPLQNQARALFAFFRERKPFSSQFRSWRVNSVVGLNFMFQRIRLPVDFFILLRARFALTCQSKSKTFTLKLYFICRYSNWCGLLCNVCLFGVVMLTVRMPYLSSLYNNMK